jgi:hypothetical protein
MKKYYLKDGGEQQGPFDLEELRAKNITIETPVWLEGQTEPVMAGQIDELNSLFTSVPLPLPTEDPLPTVNDPGPADTVVVTAAATTPVTPAPKVVKPKPVVTGQKSTAWVSWALTLLVLGGAGYFVYQNMEKSKSAVAGVSQEDTLPGNSNATTPTTTVTTTDPLTPDTVTRTNDPSVTTEPASSSTATPATTLQNQTAAEIAAAKKTEGDKNKKAAMDAQKKAEAEKKKQEAAKAAALAKEMDMRNRWPSYITLGSINPNYKGEGVEAFDVPVYNGTDVMIDKVTIRIEYLKKKEKKIFKTEDITINNIPARTTMNGRAPESKKGEKVNVIITGITSKKLHFCYPVNNGNAADPYYCN